MDTWPVSEGDTACLTWSCDIRRFGGRGLWGGKIERRKRLMTRLHELEKRLDDLEVGFGGLVGISLTLESVLELLVDRKLIPLRRPAVTLNKPWSPTRDG